MAITLVPKYVRALAEQLNAYYRVFRGTDPDSIDLRLNGGGRFAVHHSGTNAVVFQVTDAGATGTYQPGDIVNADLADGAVTSAKLADGTIMDVDVNAAAGILGSKLADGTVTSAKLADGTIVNADIAAAGTANIAVNKLAHVGAGNVIKSDGSQNVGGPLVAADIPNSSITSAKIVDNEIVNGDINAAAGILPSKLAAVTANQILKDVGSGVLGGGLLVDANVAAAGTANIALGKLLHVGAGNVLKSNGTANAAGQVVDADVATGANINGSKLADNSVSALKLSGAVPPPAGSGPADAWKAYATDSAGTTVALRQIQALHIQPGQLPTLIQSSGPLGAPSASITFSSIPQVYGSLELRISGLSTVAATSDVARLQFNGSGAAGWYNQALLGFAATTAAGEGLAATSADLGTVPAANASPVGWTGQIIAWMFGYARTTTFKTVHATAYLGWGVATSQQQVQMKGSTMTGSAAAVTSLVVFPATGSWAVGSTLSLYGYP